MYKMPFIIICHATN